MPQRCKVCAHPKLTHIDKLLATGKSSKAKVAKQFSVPPQSLYRHANEHLPAILAEAAVSKEIARGGDMLEDIRVVMTKAQIILTAAMDGFDHVHVTPSGNIVEFPAKDFKLALESMRELRGQWELLAKLQGKLLEGNVTVNNFQINADWIELRVVIFDVLSHYPDAKAALDERLQAVAKGA